MAPCNETLANLPLVFREATEADLPTLVAMLADDILGSARDDPSLPLDPGYGAAFRAILSDPGERLIVGIWPDDPTGAVVAFCQLSVIPCLSCKGRPRGQVESVRVRADLRGRGLGGALMTYVRAEARAAGCGALQLTTNAVRVDAQRFYARFGFEASHVGMKIDL